MKKQNCTGDCNNCKTPCQAIAPIKSNRKFWHIIHKIRAGMDFAFYWFFNICAILTIADLCDRFDVIG